MALWKKIVLSALVLLLLVVAGGPRQWWAGARCCWASPAIRAAPLRPPRSAKRGRYLVEARHGCVFCHSERDWKAPGAPPRRGRLGAGVVWSVEGMPWLTAPNITPDPETGIGKWSDDAVARAIREGIGLDGRALFSLMPYEEYRRIPDEDLAAIVVYIRSLAPVKTAAEEHAAVPLPLIMRPEPPRRCRPDLDPEKRGEYVLRTAACHHCHTPMKDGSSTWRSTWRAATRSPPHRARSPTNLTTDPTGIGNYRRPS
jgi:mono/diheme cytochrome c family protein